MKFGKKPVMVDAVQWDGSLTSLDRIGTLMNLPFEEVQKNVRIGIDPTFEIKTLEGVMIASLGDWVIKGIKGEFYPCKPDIFEATYERVKEEK